MSISISTFVFRLILFLGFLFLIDFYAFQGLRTALNGFVWARWVKAFYWTTHILFYSWIIFSVTRYLTGWNARAGAINFFATTIVILYIPKLFLLFFVAGEDIFRIGKWSFQSLGKVFGIAGESEHVTLDSRREFLNRAGIIVAGLPFLGFVYGALKGKYDYVIRKIKVPIAGLPDEFVGMKIAQISDLHTGSLDNPEEVERGIEMVNESGADVIVMTGDLVNNRTDEAYPFESILSKLKAPMGVVSILGNHDYGDYNTWAPGEKEKNFSEMIAVHKRMGWRLLLDEHVALERNGKSITLVGVQNISGKHNFHSYGNLKKALEGADNTQPKILLSHDPSHWEKEVKQNHPDIALMLSGHTHGAQMGVEIPGFRFSPAQLIYKQWAGLYSENGQHLYVNRGFGFIGYAGRAGIRPEITVLELVKA